MAAQIVLRAKDSPSLPGEVHHRRATAETAGVGDQSLGAGATAGYLTDGLAIAPAAADVRPRRQQIWVSPYRGRGSGSP